MTGALTFAFTDIEGSTARWERDRVAMQEAVRRHDAVLRVVIEREGGRIFKTVGDAFCAAFARPEDAVAAMVDAQRTLLSEDFSAVDGLRVRAALHSGVADERDGDFSGAVVDKVNRLLAIGYGGQVLLSDATAKMLSGALPAAVSLRDMGAYHLKGFVEPQRVYQLVAQGLPLDFPPLRSMGTLSSDRSIVDAHEFRSVPSFSGRENELAALSSALVEDGAIAVVHGLGGVGKSSIAREYGSRNRERYSVVWWLNAQNEESIVDGHLRLGSMFVPGLDQLADRRAAAQRVLNSVLSGFEKPVFLVFDNLEDEGLMHKWLPRSGTHALATSRDAAWSTDVVAISVDTWSLETATEYLRQASGRVDLREADARAIAQALGFLPLALAHAAAALRDLKTVSPQQYLEDVTFQLRIGPLGAEYPRSVFATFNTAIARAEQQAEGAAAVLCFGALFAPDAIPDELFRQATENYGDGLRPVLPGVVALDLNSVISDDLCLDEALGALDRLSLLAFGQGSGAYNMHRLVQLAALDLIGEAASRWRERAVAVALAAFPRANFTTWPQCERILPHARAALDALEAGTELPSAAALARRCANYLWARGEYGASERLSRLALTIYERARGSDHLDVALSLNNLGVLYMELGRFAESERLHGRALTIREKALGKDDPLIATTLHNLGIVCMELSRYAESEAYHRRALTIREKTSGRDHPLALLSLQGLGVLYRLQGRHPEAETLHARVLLAREESFGADHPDVALSLMLLADVYADSERCKEAEPLYLRALATWEKAFGLFESDHPDVAEALNGLGNVYRRQHRYGEAESLFTRALTIRERSYGPDHPLTRTTRSALEELYSESSALPQPAD